MTQRDERVDVEAQQEALRTLDVWGSFDDGTLVGSLMPMIVRHELERRGLHVQLRFLAPIGDVPAGGLAANSLVSPFPTEPEDRPALLMPRSSVALFRAMLRDNGSPDADAEGLTLDLHLPPCQIQLDDRVNGAGMLLLIDRVLDLARLRARAEAVRLRGSLPNSEHAPLVVIVGRESIGRTNELVGAIARSPVRPRRQVLVVPIGDGESGRRLADDVVRLLDELHGMTAAVFATGDPVDVVALIAAADRVVAGPAGAAAIAAALGRPHAVVGDGAHHPVPGAVVEHDRIEDAFTATSDPQRWAAATLGVVDLIDDAFDRVVTELEDVGAVTEREWPEPVLPVEAEQVVLAIESRAETERARWTERVRTLESDLASATTSRRDLDRLRKEVERYRTELIRMQASMVAPVAEAHPATVSVRALVRSRGRDRLVAAAGRNRIGRVALAIARRLRRR